MHLFMSVGVIVIGLYLALVADLSEGSPMRTFGWVFVVLGLLALLSRAIITRADRDGDSR